MNNNEVFPPDKLSINDNQHAKTQFENEYDEEFYLWYGIDNINAFAI